MAGMRTVSVGPRQRGPCDGGGSTNKTSLCEHYVSASGEDFQGGGRLAVRV